MSEDTVAQLADKLVAIGIETEEDLQLLKEEDLVPIVNVIQARKLLHKLQQNHKFCFIKS